MIRGSFRKLLACTLLVLAWFSFLVHGSHALLSDTATLAGNTISTGSFDLQISNSQNGSSTSYADSKPGFNVVLSPGQSQEQYFFLKNVSSTTSNLAIDVIAAIQTANPDLASEVVIEFAPVDSTGVATGAMKSTKLSELNSHLALPVSIAQGATQRFKMRVVLTLNYMQINQSVGYDLVFTGIQQAS